MYGDIGFYPLGYQHFTGPFKGVQAGGAAVLLDFSLLSTSMGKIKQVCGVVKAFLRQNRVPSPRRNVLYAHRFKFMI